MQSPCMMLSTFRNTFMTSRPYIFIFVLLMSCQDSNSSRDSSENPSKPEMDTTLWVSHQEDSVSNYTEGKYVTFKSRYNFSTFKEKVFEGAIAAPDFSTSEFSDDPEYVRFIENGCKGHGINFGGHYTILERSCGAMCSHIFIIDRISGKIFTDITPNDGRWGYMYKSDSRLLIANSETFTDSSLTTYWDFFAKPELYEWKENNFKILE